MKILVACEESQVVTKAFRAKGHLAYSCDIKDCTGGHPEWHLKGDVLRFLDDGWDMMIGHPPCTYLSKIGAANFYSNGRRVEERFKRQEEARHFFLKLWNANIPRICLENPVAMKTANLPPFSQVIYPELFGARFTKRTLLWLKGLPPLLPRFTGSELDLRSLCSVKRSPAERSKTFPEIAEEMANQWNFERSDK